MNCKILLIFTCAALLAQTSAVPSKDAPAATDSGWVTPVAKAPGVTHHVFRSAAKAEHGVRPLPERR
jgi:hypothetical protein